MAGPSHKRARTCWAAFVVFKKPIDDAGPSAVLCLEVGMSDAPATLIAKLRRSDRTIVPGSQCTPAEGSVKPSFHTATHRAAHFLYVSNPSSGYPSIPSGPSRELLPWPMGYLLDCRTA